MITLTLGEWTLHTVEAGFLWLDGGSMFGSVPKPLWSRTNPADERNRIRLAMQRLPATGMLSGVVEADETYVGGRPRYKAATRQEAAKRRMDNKTAVVNRPESNQGGAAFIG